jgi:regulator of protease activity HflC (stomatin/prohibitin superfamily)
VPFIDRLKPLIDLRERVVSFPPQPVITSDNLVVEIDTVIYFQVTNPKSAVYEIENFITGIEQITITTLRNVVGGIDLEQTLTSRDSINSALGVRVNRVELKSIEPPQTVKTAMELQMKAERERRAVILTAEGEKQSQILTAEGARQAAILNAEGAAKAIVIKAEAEAEAVQRVFDAVRSADLDDKMLAYQYLEQLPVIANGTASKLWLLPSELSGAIEKIASAFRPGK